MLAGVAVTLLVYGAFIAALVAAGRREDARALAGFVPDCVVLFRRLLADARVPRSRKLVLWGLIAYLALPIDVVPDFIPVAGQPTTSSPWRSCYESCCAADANWSPSCGPARGRRSTSSSGSRISVSSVSSPSPQRRDAFRVGLSERTRVRRAHGETADLDRRDLSVGGRG